MSDSLAAIPSGIANIRVTKNEKTCPILLKIRSPLFLGTVPIDWEALLPLNVLDERLLQVIH